MKLSFTCALVINFSDLSVKLIYRHLSFLKKKKISIIAFSKR